MSSANKNMAPRVRLVLREVRDLVDRVPDMIAEGPDGRDLIRGLQLELVAAVRRLERMEGRPNHLRLVGQSGSGQ
jgi:hypothetical protein